MLRKKTISNPLSVASTSRRHNFLRGTSRNARGGVVPLQIVVMVVGVCCCLGLMTGLYFFVVRNSNGGVSSSTTTTTGSSAVVITPAIDAVRKQFYDRYGGKTAGDDILSKGVHGYGTSLAASARRMVSAAAAGRPFVLAFAGYSVTVGRGNRFEHSFPFCLERILKPVLRESVLHLDLIVRNAAIGGIPSFPYAFCFEHFLGSDADVVSWDYSMNEGNGAAVLESYVRHSQHQLQHQPMMIVLDSNKQRCKLLEQYIELGVLKDALCLGKAKDVVPTPKFLELPDDQKPPGFRDWMQFGAPDSCPGRGSWHPRKQEHELLGWMLAMYFLQALEEAERIVQNESLWQQRFSVPMNDKNKRQKSILFPATIHTPPTNDEAVTGLLYGHRQGNGAATEFVMKDVSCRTNFLPAVDETKVLGSVVVSGMSSRPTASNIMEQRTDEDYKQGWVLDVSNVERDTKVKVERCGGLGYIDMKIALYGVAESGTLRLWLPSEGPSHETSDQNPGPDSAPAKHWFHGLVICEANEKRPEGACQLDKDIEFTVGSSKVPTTRTKMIKGAAEYLKRKTCVSVGIPESATVTKLGDVKTVDGIQLSEQDRIRLAGDNAASKDQIGLLVDVKAAGHITREKGACCLSHIVWEQH